jgi:pSer/pThr/pTyr-binding forkhead associated (FHA) protein
MELPPGEHSIGRGEGCRINVGDMRVSRQHAVLRSSADGWSLEDLESTCGTFLDGRRTQRLVITGPVEVLLGDPADGTRLLLEPVVEWQEAPPTGEIARPSTQVPAPAGAPAPPAVPPDGARRPRPTGVFASMHAAGECTLLGRDATCDIVVEDLLVSRYHAELRRTPDGRYEIEDLGSRNGTFVNGRTGHPPVLDDLDLVGIGHSTFLFAARHARGVPRHRVGHLRGLGHHGVGSHGRPLLDDVSASASRERSLLCGGRSRRDRASRRCSPPWPAPSRDRGRCSTAGATSTPTTTSFATASASCPRRTSCTASCRCGRPSSIRARLRFPAEVTEHRAHRSPRRGARRARARAPGRCAHLTACRAVSESGPAWPSSC